MADKIYDHGEEFDYRKTRYAVEEDQGSHVLTQCGLRIRKRSIAKDQLVTEVPQQWQKYCPDKYKARVKQPQDPEFGTWEQYGVNPVVANAITQVMGFTDDQGNRTFSPYRHQGEAYQAIKQRSTLLAYAVSAGKTLAAALYSLEAMMPEAWGGKWQQVIYIAPTKALASDQAKSGLAEAQRNYEKSLARWRLTGEKGEQPQPDPHPRGSIVDVMAYLGLSYSVIHGDIASQDRDYSASMIFTNQFSFDQMLVNKDIDPRNIGVIVLDESHTLAQGPSGGHLGGTLRNYNHLREAMQPGIDPVRYILLSATVESPHEVAKQVTEQDCTVLDKSYARVGERTVIAKFAERGKRNEHVNFAVSMVKDGYGGFIFIDSRRGCETAAKQINELMGSEVAGYYHSKMAPDHKDEVLDRVKAGELKVIVSTSCLEAGIDLPDFAQFVVIIAKNIDPSSVLQRLGRGGRNGEPCLGYCIVDRSVYSLDAFLDRQCNVIMPSFVPPIQTIQANRLAWCLATQVRHPDPVGYAKKIYPLADIDAVPPKSPFRNETLFAVEPEVRVVLDKGNRTITKVGLSTALSGYLPGCVVQDYNAGKSIAYEVVSLDTRARICIVKYTKELVNFPTPVTKMFLGDHEVHACKSAINRSGTTLSSGYGKLVDTCEQVTIDKAKWYSVCRACGKENYGYAKRCAECGHKSLDKRNRNPRPITHTIDKVSNHFTGSFVMLDTLDEDLGLSSGAAYAIVRVLTRLLNLREDEVGVGYTKSRVVFYDRHVHGAATDYLFKHWRDVIKETEQEVRDCVCDVGCSNCTGKLRGSSVQATKKDVSIESLRQLRLLQFN